MIHDDLSLSLNPHSWNSAANVIWIDQPVGSGYSYADAGDSGPWSEAEIADNVFQFLQGFIAQYPKYAKLPFYITGESYGQSEQREQLEPSHAISTLLKHRLSCLHSVSVRVLVYLFNS